MKALIAIMNLLTILILNLQISAQQVGSWDLIGKFKMKDNYNLYTRGINSTSIAMSSKNNIVALSQDTTGLKGSGRVSQPTIVLSTDGGIKWETIRRDINDDNHNYVCLAHPSDNLIVVAGDTVYKISNLTKAGAFLLISRDTGISWEIMYLDSNTTISDLCMTDSLNGALIKWTLSNSNNNTNDNIPDSIYITNDGWYTWKSIPAPDNLRMGSLKIVYKDSLTIALYGYYIVDYSYHVWITSDGGENWIKSQIFPVKITASYNLKYFSHQNIWLVGGYQKSEFGGDRLVAVALKSIDGGINWIKIIIDNNDTLDMFYDIDFIDENNGVIVGSRSKIYRTTNGGNSWFREFFDFSYPITFHNFRNVLLFKNYSFIHETLNGTGNSIIYSYNPIITLSSPIINDLYISDPKNTKIEWKKVEVAERYRIQIDNKVNFDTTNFINPIVDTTVIDTNVIINTLNYNQKYYVRAQAINDSQTSKWNLASNYFYTIEYEGQLLPLKIYLPEQYSMNVSLTPTFIWEKIEDASSYLVSVYWMYTIDKFKVFSKEFISDTSFTLPIYLDTNKTYIVLVWYKIGDEWSIWSEVDFHTLKSITSVTEPFQKIPSKLYPNPCNDFVILNNENEETTNTNIEIFDILGTRLYNFIFKNSKQYILNTSKLLPGVYFVRVRSARFDNVYKVIKVE